MTSPTSPVGYVPPANWASPTNAELCSALSDYLGLPTKVASLSHSSLWHRAYNLIWNEWFRDENLQNSVVVDKGDGPDSYLNYPLLKRGKRHDYFTSCLPWPQKGPSVSLPLGVSAPITGIGTWDAGSLAGSIANVRETSSTGVTYSNYATMSSAGPDLVVKADSNTAGSWKPQIFADLTTATAATINQLRQAFQLQRLAERDARGGTRYTEIIQSHFGVTSPDFRLQRPEYLGGGRSYINFTPIAQTSATSGQPTPQANLSAMATLSVTGGHGWTKSFTEHCVLLGLACVYADLTYQQGLPRMFSRSTRYDFYWPALAHIGEQAVLNKEIYAQGTSADNDVFGYQERHAEYRYKPSLATGRFRSNDALTLDSWHLAQNFSSLPTLSAAFIVENPPLSRILAVSTEPQILLDVAFRMKCVRPMPVYSVPGQIDHF